MQRKKKTQLTLFESPILTDHFRASNQLYSLKLNQPERSVCKKATNTIKKQARPHNTVLHASVNEHFVYTN